MTSRPATHRSPASMLERLRDRRHAITRAEVIAAIGRRRFDRLVARGQLVRLLMGVYAPADLAGHHDVRCHAVTLASKGSVLIAGRSALHLYQELFPAPGQVEVQVVPGAKPPSAPWITARSGRRPRATGFVGDIATMLPQDAMVDAWARAPTAQRTGLLYEALWLRIVRPHGLLRAASARARLPSRAQLTAILGDFIDGARSPGEVLAKREVFCGPRYRAFERQVPMRIGGKNREVDMLHRAARLVVEVDSDRYHGTLAAVASDRRRDIEFGAAGYQTVRFSFRDLRDRPEWCRQMLDQVLAARLRAA